MNFDRSKLKLRRETHWYRVYDMEAPDHSFHESKFRDGSATITLAELKKEWPTWSDWERTDFCQEVCEPGCRDMPEVLQFVMAQGEPRHWAAIALKVVYHLPADETIPFLLNACEKSDPEHLSNIMQALAKSGAPEAHNVLRDHLSRLWAL